MAAGAGVNNAPTFLTQDDPLYILPFFESFFAQDLAGIEVTGIFACRSMGRRKRSTLLRELARFTVLRLRQTGGSASLAPHGSECAPRVSPRQISFTPGTRDETSCSLPRIGDPNAPFHYEVITSHQPEILVSVACPFILKRPMLELPLTAALNIHHAPLPKYKGMMPTFWQMYHGEHSVGITIHTMVDRLDDGSILRQESVPVIHGESMHSLIRRSKRNGGKAMVEGVEQFAVGETPSGVQSHRAKPPISPSPTQERFRIFPATGDSKPSEW